MTRDAIIEALQNALRPEPWAHAFWLEGADASGWLDEYSDFDFWLDIEDAFEEEAYRCVEETLERLAPLDVRHAISHPHPKIRQRFYHLRGTSPYWMVDFCWQLHSRPAEQTQYAPGNAAESAKVLFDKRGVVRFVPEDPRRRAERNRALLREAEFQLTQSARAEKYVRRGQLPEAQWYYRHYLLEPVVTLMRLLHAPENADMGLCHLSMQLPPEALRLVEKLCADGSLEDIDRRIPEALRLGEELLKRLWEPASDA